MRSCNKQKSKSVAPASRGGDKAPSKTQSKFFDKKSKMAQQMKKKRATTPSKIIREPPSLTCYIWGRKYGTTSLNIHLKSCKKKWEIEQSQLPKNQRRPCPEPPKTFDDIPTKGLTSEAMQQYNEEAFKDWNEKALVPCGNWGRTFLPDRLTIHLRSCKPKDSKTPLVKDGKAVKLSPIKERPERKAPSSVKKTRGPGIVPPGLICYIWGRKYGTTSLNIHLKSWKKQFEIEQSRLPSHQRRRLPEAPTQFDEINVKGMNDKQMDQYNEEAFKNYNEKALVPCQNWGRTFLPDRLTVHARSCKPKNSEVKTDEEPVRKSKLLVRK